MKRAVPILLVSVLALSLLAGCGLDPKTEINAVLDQYAAAFKAEDIVAMGETLDDTVTTVHSDGTSATNPRSTYLAAMGVAFAFVQVTDFQILNRQIAVAGDTADVVATVRLAGYGTNGFSDKSSPGEIWLAKRQDGWKIFKLR